MARKQPTAPPFSWIKAPLGWWFKGKGGRKLAHIWKGQDKRTHAVLLKKNRENVVLDPFEEEAVAMRTIADALTPAAPEPEKTEGAA
jgi:hypothetical protein